MVSRTCDGCGKEFNSLAKYRLHNCNDNSEENTDSPNITNLKLKGESDDDLIKYLPPAVRPKGLPNRKLKHQETLDMWETIEEILSFMPKSAPADKTLPAIDCAMIATPDVLAVIGYTASEEWEVVDITPKPAGVFERDYITGEDHAHPAVETMSDKMDAFIEQKEQELHS